MIDEPHLPAILRPKEQANRVLALQQELAAFDSAEAAGPIADFKIPVCFLYVVWLPCSCSIEHTKLEDYQVVLLSMMRLWLDTICPGMPTQVWVCLCQKLLKLLLPGLWQLLLVVLSGKLQKLRSPSPQPTIMVPLPQPRF